MKPKYKLDAYVLVDGDVLQIEGIHMSEYSNEKPSLQYQTRGSDDFISEEDIEYELVKKGKK